VTLAALAAAIGAPVLARDAEPAVSTIVHFADLDLTRPGDVRRLRHRIANAANEVCGEPSSADPAGKVDAARCRAETMRATDVRREALAAADRLNLQTAARR
jgi:UrcA family protein